MTDCTLCGLPTPDSPHTAADAEGEFCCRGCLEVAQQLDDVDAADAGTARERLAADAGGSAAPDNTDGEEAFLTVEGMHCGTCEAFIEGRATDHEGVQAAEASYTAELVRLVYDPDTIAVDDLPPVLSGLGYEAHPLEEGPPTRQTSPPWRLLVGGFCGMMVMMWYLLFLYPRYFGFTPEDAAWQAGPVGTLSLGNLWVLSSVVLFYTGYPILRGAYVSIRSRHPNMDLLVALAAVNAYVYSGAVVLTGGTEVYFDISVVVVLVVTLGSHYEERIKRKATATLEDLTRAQVETAERRLPDPASEGGEGGVRTEEVSVSDLEPGDEVVVRPGERVPVDGTVVEGTAAVDESLVTGESVPVRKGAGDEVIGGAVVTDDALVVSVGEDAASTLDRIVRLLWTIQSARPGAQRLADKLAAIFVPLVLVLALLAVGWQLVVGAGATAALLTGLAVLVVSCPCALGLATPLAVAAGVRDGLEGGIVVRGGGVFEAAAETDVVAFDKTGTLTTGEMRVVDPATDEAMARAAAVEQFASHPIGEAVTDHTTPPDRTVTDFERHPGQGVSATVDGERIVVGHPDLLESVGLAVPDSLAARADDARAEGHVPVLVGWAGEARDVVVVGDQPRPEWASVVTDLADAGREVAVITGDDERAASRFREHPDVTHVFADVRPEAKAEVVERLRSEGVVAMVGDGSNDAPALAAADLGIALGSGTAMAADAADVVLTGDDLTAVPRVFELTRATKRRIRQNLGWAFLYNAVAVPMAILGHINPLVAAVAMATSSLLVVSNSSRDLLDGLDRAADTDSASPAGDPPATETEPGASTPVETESAGATGVSSGE
jgi:Cu2+-exporting ATPase